MSVEIPKAAVVFGGVTPPQGDIIDLKVHLGCTKEVSSFNCLLQNWNKKYSPGGTSPISVGDDGHIDIGRGANVPQIITCRVEKVHCESPTPNEHYIRVSGRGWGERIFRRVITKVYENKKGEEIVKDIIDNYVGLSHVRDSTELIEDTDTTYTYLEYENTPVFDILKYIAESSDKAGVIGYDFRVAPDGKFEFFPKNSKASPVSLSEKIESSEYRKDIHRVRNKIMIYGLADKSVPADKDAWTESLTPDDGSWSAAAGEVSLDTTFKAKGSASIKVHSVSMYWVGAVFTLNAGKEVDANKYPLLSFLAYLEKSYNGNVSIMLYDQTDKTASKNITIAPGKWRKTDVKVGLANEMEWTDVDAGFDWSNIKKVRIDGWFSGVGSGDFWIDQLYFGGRRYSATREDATSQSNYGLRELVEVDEELVSDNECDLRAKALLDYFKNAAEYLKISTTVLDYGNTPLLPADKIPVMLPNENVDSYFRIGSVEYYVNAETQTLEITPELGKVPPLLADYLYGLRATTVTVEKLARTKLGKGAIPTALGGGLGAHHVGHQAGDDTGAPWPSEDDGGWDKIIGWICPTFIGPRSNTAAVVQFRTKNIAGSGIVDHQFNPSNHEHGIMGTATKRWLEICVKYLDVSAQAKLAQLNIGEEIVITSARVLQNVLADAAIITSGNFEASRMPRGTDGYVLEAQGAEMDPMYVNPNYRYEPKSHPHSEHTGIGPNDHHAQAHNHAGETLSPNAVSCNSISIAASCNKEYSHPSSQQCVYATSIAWENCPHYSCVNYSAGDLCIKKGMRIPFINGMAITEAESLGLGPGFAFLNRKGKVIMVLDEDGNIEISGKIKEGVAA